MVSSKVVFAGAVLVGFAALVTDLTAGAPIRPREANQVNRVAAGVSSGSLTVAELARLFAGQAHIRRDVNRAAADGRVTPREEVHIQHELNCQSAMIFREKHDAQVMGIGMSIPARQVRQDVRVRHGVANGSLTADELQQVREGRREVREDIREARFDGRVTVPERIHIQREFNEQSDLIYREKHD